MESVNVVEKKIKAGYYGTNQRKGKSDIWKKILIVTDKSGKELVLFVAFQKQKFYWSNKKMLIAHSDIF